MLMGAGIVIILLSFVVGRSKKVEQESEDLAVTMYNETAQIKRRLKVIEEELLLDTPTIKAAPQKAPSAGIHQILISQVLALHKQGYNITQIADRSSLSTTQIEQIIATGGKLS